MLADGHLDLCYDLLRRRQRGEVGSLAGEYLPRWRRAGVGLVVAAVYVDTLEREEDYYGQAMQQLDALRGELAGVEGDVALCTGAGQLTQARARGQVALLLSLEGAEPVGPEWRRLEEFYRLGVRLLGLTWSRNNRAGCGGGYEDDPASDAPGLTPFGRALAVRAEELGMLLDLSHLNQGGCDDVAALARRPFFASHSNARALRPMNRNLSDRTLRAIAGRGGVVGLNGFSGLVAGPEGATVAALAEQADYLRAILGPGGVGLGLDLMGPMHPEGVPFTAGGVTVPGFDILPDHSAVPALLAELARRGYGREELAEIAGENWFRFFSQNLP